MIFSAKKVSPVVHSSSPFQQSSPVIIDSRALLALHMHMLVLLMAQISYCMAAHDTWQIFAQGPYGPRALTSHSANNYLLCGTRNCTITKQTCCFSKVSCTTV